VPNSGRIISYGLLALFITAGMSVSAKADTTYTYTGPAFNFFYGAVCPPNCNITGSFTLLTPLAANDNMVELPAGTPFSFSSGPYTATQANVASPSTSIQISTNAAGMIDLWDIDLFDFSDGFDIFTADQGMAGASYDQFGKLEPNPPDGYKSAGGADDTGGVITFGTWTVSTTGVPEPASRTLLGVGLLGLAALTPRKFRTLTFN